MAKSWESGEHWQVDRQVNKQVVRVIRTADIRRDDLRSNEEIQGGSPEKVFPKITRCKEAEHWNMRTEHEPGNWLR